jgi:hypothetical protein
MPHSIDDPRYPVRKSDAQWREQLSDIDYQVTRRAATERAVLGPLGSRALRLRVLRRAAVQLEDEV